ncbi:MAG: FAD-binding oxidoreductase [Burkholderiales bacterium]|nr:FAD-binding oxidoreductase [Burkholderiales bacterium]
MQTDPVAPQCFDIAIVGAGIAGASLAFRLASQASVILLERESHPGYHATGRSAAMFMESYGPTGVRALTRASRAFYEAPPPGFADHPILTPRGALYVAAPGQEALLASTRAALAPNCPRLATLDAGATLAAAPCLKPDRVAGALLDPDSMDIDVHGLHQGFLRAFRAAGGTLRCDAELVAATRAAGAWQLQLADGATIHAGVLVDAAGAWADQVAALCGARPVGLTPRRRSAFTFDAPAGVACAHWPAVVGIDETWYFKPDAGQLLGSPANADDTVPHDVAPEELDIALGIDRIQAATTLTIRRPRHAWAGLRSFVADGEPVIGFDGELDGFFWLAAQGGYGIQSAAGAAALAAALLLAGPLPPECARQAVDAACFAPARLRPAG